MDDPTDVSIAESEEIEVNPLVHLVAPVAAIIGTIVVRKLVNSAYERVAGHPAPQPRDPQISFMKAIMWTAVITASAAIAEVAVYRLVNAIGARRA